MSRQFILTCGCGDTPSFARDVYEQLYPGTPVPQMISGSSNLYKLYEKYPNDGDFSRYVHSLSRNKTKFAYLVERDEDGSLTHIVDLKTARRLA